MIRHLSDLPLPKVRGAAMKVCVVSSEFQGPVRSGGIAAATTGLLDRLVADGHGVTLLYTLVQNGMPECSDKDWGYWVHALRKQGIQTEHIPHQGGYWQWREKSWQVKEFIARREFDLVYFNDHHGSGYYAQLAKRSGLAPFSQQLHCVITHAAMEWVFDVNEQYALGRADFELMALERGSVELADAVIGPSQYLLRQYERFGWRLPANSFVQAYPLSQERLGNLGAGRPSRPRIPIHEMVFFGRLEVRKGLWLFCEAVDRLGERLRAKTITFLGRTTEASGLSSALRVVNRSVKWPACVKLLTDLNRDDALDYLREPGRLAVMPSLSDNSPCVVYECLEASIPFLTTRGSGADELVHRSCWDDIMVEPNVDALSESLARILDSGASLGRWGLDPKENLATWSAWHSYLSKDRRKLMVPSAASPSVIVPQSADATSPALVVVIDKGDCTLARLVDGIQSHVRRFGKRAAYLILSSRQGKLQEILFALFNEPSAAEPLPICILDPRAIGEAKEIIRRSAKIFFLDAELELQTAFFVLASNILESEQPALVSCFVAVRDEGGRDLEIEELPVADVVGLTGLGYPTGGGAWAASSRGLDRELGSLELYDAQCGELLSSAIIGQLFMQRCRLTNVPLHVIPVVGAVENRQRHRRSYMSLSREPYETAAALNINPASPDDSPAWLAISRFGKVLQRSWHTSIETQSFLSPEHPLSAFDHDADDVAEFAAALGRKDLVFQASGEAEQLPEGLRRLLDLSAKSSSMRPTLDLTKWLISGQLFEFGRRELPEPIMQSDQPSRPDSAPPNRADAAHLERESVADRVYVDGGRLRVEELRIAAKPGAEGSGKVVFTDVPLCGNTELKAKLRSASLEWTSIEVSVLDQRNGATIETVSAYLSPGRACELSLPLYGMYKRVSIVLEFKRTQDLDVTIEALHIW